MTQIIAAPIITLIEAVVVWAVLYSAIRRGVRDGIRDARNES